MVTDWIEIGSDKMRMARRRVGNPSADEMAHRLRTRNYKVIGRTYLRWEKDGKVPRDALPAISAVLGFDVGQILADQPTRVQWQQVGDVLGQVAAAVESLVELLAEQREIVLRLETIAAALQQPGASEP